MADYDPSAIADLFSEDATCRYHPWDDPITGRDAIVASWLDNRDEPGSWTAWYRPYAMEGDRASVIGESRYTNPDGSLLDLYYNHWTLQFDDDGRCTEFAEYFMQLPKRLKANR